MIVEIGTNLKEVIGAICIVIMVVYFIKKFF